MTTDKAAAKRKFNITIMRPVFQVATLEIEAATSDEAIEIAQERDLTLQESGWQGPFERAIYEETNNDSLQMFSRIPKPAVPDERN